MEITTEDIGKRVRFKSPTAYINKEAVRIITGVRENGSITVKSYQGWTNFVVLHREIIGLE